MRNKRRLLFSTAFVFLMFSPSSQAQVFFDTENDPIPLFDLTVILPQGTASSDPKEAVNYSLMQSLLSAGTLRLKREDFYDQLGEFGANFSFSMSGQYSTWTLSFPYREGQDYKKLVSLLKENWETPRFTVEEFKRYQKMGLNNIKSSLNNDSQLATGTARRWIFKKFLGFSPIFQESFQWAKLNSIRDLYVKNIKNPSQLWAGFVGPPSLKPLAKEMITKVFGNLEFQEGEHLEQLASKNSPSVTKAAQSKTLLIVAKPGRTQNMTTLMAFNPHKLEASHELDFLIGDHVAVSGGLGSLYGEALRTKGGFSYTVASTSSPSFAGFPILGFFSNPMSSKQDAAMKAISELLKETYDGNIFTAQSQVDWETRIKSFSYEKTFSQMTADARLNERQAVVLGTQSPELFRSNPLNWNAGRSDVQEFFKNHWNKAQIVMAIVGDPKELSNVAKKYFPDYQVKVIPYVETISSKTFD